MVVAVVAVLTGMRDRWWPGNGNENGDGKKTRMIMILSQRRRKRRKIEDWMARLKE